MKHLLSILLLAASVWAANPQNWTRVVLGNSYSSAGGFAIFIANEGSANYNQTQGLAIKVSINDDRGELWVLNSQGKTYRRNRPDHGWWYMGSAPGFPRDICVKGEIPTMVTSSGLYTMPHPPSGWQLLVPSSSFWAVGTTPFEDGPFVLMTNNRIRKYLWNGTLEYDQGGPPTPTNDISISCDEEINVTAIEPSYRYWTLYREVAFHWIPEAYPSYAVDFTKSYKDYFLAKAQDPNNLYQYKTYFCTSGGSMQEETGVMNHMINDIAIGHLGWDATMLDGNVTFGAKDSVIIEE